MPRFSSEFLDELKSRLRPSDVIGRHLKLRKQGAEWAACSPFTNEKTPSFFVNDQKGFFHCFSSGKHGDVISFLQETQNLTFAEAVARLAEEAGMSVPSDDRSPQRSDAEAERLARLRAASNAAARFFREALASPAGREARAYLERREVSDAQIGEFAIGFAPAARAALKSRLLADGHREADLVDAGLIIRPEDGGETYDRFRGRIMFPIRDRRDDAIAFGGRALDPNARAKYLNSPETPLFTKGAVLYRYEAARAAAKDAPLIVCEGYMDVIALWGAGFETAVAPLGTALTERQLALLWRACDEPVLCFDGDAAGRRAAHRSIDRALPLLKPGKSLNFAFLPAGKDPDDLIRDGGPSAFRDAIDAAQPLATTAFEREAEAGPRDTPERRADFKRRLRALVAAIADADVREAYGAAFAKRLRDEAGQTRETPRGPAGRDARRNPWRGPSRGAGPRAGFEPGQAAGEKLRRQAPPVGYLNAATLVLALVRHPGVIEALEADFMALDVADPDLRALLDDATAAIYSNDALDSADLASHLQKSRSAATLGRLEADTALNAQSFLRTGAGLNEAVAGCVDAFRVHRLSTEALRDLTEAATRASTDGEERWKAAVLARRALAAPTRDPSDNGEAAETDGELAATLERMRRSVGGGRD